MGLRNVLVDAWSWLNYKPIFSDPARGMPHRRAFPEAQASWVPAEDERRLAAYKLLAAYDQNQAAELAAVADGDIARERREFGDPSMFIDTLVAHVLGREQHLVVPGADSNDGPASEPGAAMASRVQGLLEEWAERELLPMRVQQAERKAVGLGDGVYRLAWDPGRRRVTVRAVDPGFYFPVIGEDDDGGEFPDRVHFAWELPEDTKRGLKPRLRRITYELGPIAGPQEPDGQALENPGAGGAGPSRLYPWNDEPSTRTCYLTDATWELGDLKAGTDIDSLPLDRATFATRSDGTVLDRLDLVVDFLPVIHVPNTVPPAEEHWGQSSLAKVLQVFDELQGSDTDSARASATTGLPMVGISGVTDPRAVYQVAPGAVFTLGDGGRLTTIDTSPALRELREHRHDLSDRAANVARLPAVALGTLNPTEAPSGFAMQVSLGPLDALIASMRLARDHKYALLLKLVQRLHLAGQHPDWAGVTVQPAKLTFGPYTPTDKTAVLEQVALGVEKRVLSLETAVRMLMDAGLPIDDAAEEIERIQSRAFTDARDLADALGSTDEVAAFLGRTPPADDTVPALRLPDPAAPEAGDEGAGEGPRGSGGNTP